MDPKQQLDQKLQEPPQSSGAYNGPSPNYAPDYLDSIAPAARKRNFINGNFGKLFWILIALFVVVVSFVVAGSSGKAPTADLELIAVRTDNFQQITKKVKNNLKSQNLIDINQSFNSWLLEANQKSEDLLKTAKVQKSNYNKSMVKTEKLLLDTLNAKFEDARLAASLNGVYASTMSAETTKMINVLNSIAKKNGSSKIRQFAKDEVSSLIKIKDQFNSFVDDGN